MGKFFGKNLKSFRTSAGMTQTELAKALGITRSSVNNYESRNTEPTFEILCKMASVLGVEITDLITEQTVIPNFIRMAQVTDKESALLQAFREADPIYQGVALDILRQHQKEGG